MGCNSTAQADVLPAHAKAMCTVEKRKLQNEPSEHIEQKGSGNFRRVKIGPLGNSIGRQFLMDVIGPPGNAIFYARIFSIQSVGISLEWQRTFYSSQS
jgi:hypothetical protein